MGWRKRSENTASIAVQPSPSSARPVVHNHNKQPGRVGEILSWGFLVIVGTWLAWLALIHILEQAGARDGERAAAQLLLSIVIVVCAAGFAWVIGKSFLIDYYKYRREIEAIRADVKREEFQALQLAAPATKNSMTIEDARLYQAVIKVMDSAYRGRIDEDGNLIGQLRPWSKRSVGRLELMNEDGPVGENSNLATGLAGKLIEWGILEHEKKVNIASYPDLYSVRVEMERRFGRPIIRNGNGSGGNFASRYEHI